uniref:Uncharacterized protein n=1 Tax=Oryza nivara TaxID=4536 RepID=A0A0E0H272_ORYNI
MSALLGAPRVRELRDAREREAAALIAAVAAAGASPVNLSDMVAATSSRIVRRVAFGDGDGDGDESMDVKAVLDETQSLLGAIRVSKVPTPSPQSPPASALLHMPVHQDTTEQGH